MSLIDRASARWYSISNMDIGVIWMLLIAKRLCDLNFSLLMEVYFEGNLEKSVDYGEGGLLRAEQEFRDYLREDFFRQKDAFYAIWQESGKYISALRLEPFLDGWLMEALETVPDLRRRGYAKKLISAVLEYMGVERIYSHVYKWNEASLRIHYACGFEVYLDHAVYVDGSVTNRSYTLRFMAKGK